MKRNLLLITTFSVLTFCSIGQVEIRPFAGGQGTGNNIAGTEIVVIATVDGTQATDLQVRNVSGSSKTWRVERLRLQDVTPWIDYLCWGLEGDLFGQCYSAQGMSTNPWTSPSNFSVTVPDGGNGILKVETDNHGSGTEMYRYYIIEGQSTRVDSIDVRVTSVLSIADQQQEEVSVSVYPNPVATTMMVNTTGIDGTFEVKMTDVLGKVVMNESSNQGKKSIDVSNFKNGVYLVSVYNKGELIQTRRIVIKH
jgi:hypothetical protein